MAKNRRAPKNHNYASDVQQPTQLDLKNEQCQKKRNSIDITK